MVSQEMKLFRKLQYSVFTEFFLDQSCFSWLFSIGDAPYCTPEQYKECADPALGKEPLPYVACVQCFSISLLSAPDPCG